MSFRAPRHRYDASRLVVLATSLLTASSIVVLALGHWSLLVPFWYAPAGLHPAVWRLAPGVLTLLVYLAGCWLLDSRTGWLSVAWSAAGGVAIPLALLFIMDNPLRLLFACGTAGDCTGGFAASIKLTSAMLRQWPNLMPGWRNSMPHLSISGPGWPLLHLAASRSLEHLPWLSQALAGPLRPLQCDQWSFLSIGDARIASAWVSIASPLWSALAAVPLYTFGRRLAGPQIAGHAVRWWPLVPALSLFTATLTPSYTLPAVSAVALLWSGSLAAGRHPWRAALLFALAGALLALALLLNFSLVPLLMLGGFLVLCGVWRQQRTLAGTAASMVLPTVAFLGGVMAAWLPFWRVAGYWPWSLLPIAMSIHLRIDQPYLVAMGLHAWDFFVFAGLPACGLALAYALSRPKARSSYLALAFGATMTVLLLSGTARGEVGRVWSFFMPFVVLIAAYVLRQLNKGQRILLMSLQAAWLFALAATVTPVNTWLTPPPRYEQVALPALNTPVIPADATFGAAVHLTGVQTQYRPESGKLAIALHWRPLQSMSETYYFSGVLVGPDGRVLPGVDWQPFANRYPTTCWGTGGSGQEIVDQVELPLGPNAISGDWWLSLSMFAIEKDQAQPPVPVLLADGSADKQAGVGPLRVKLDRTPGRLAAQGPQPWALP